jgi:hypothetical protein
VSLLRLLLPLLPEILQLLPEARLESRRLTRRFALQAELILALTLILVAATGFAVAAGYMALAEALSPAAAAAIVALCLCFVALLVGMTLMLLNRQWEARRARAPNGGNSLLPLAELARQVEAKPVQSIVIAAAIGLIVASLGRRR